MKTLHTFFLAGVVLAGAVSPLAAAQLNFANSYTADLYGSPLDVTFASNNIAGGGTFTMDGSLSDYIQGNGNDTSDFSGYGGYSLSANINSGIIQAGGTVTIFGFVGPSHTSSQTLLTGTLKTGASGTAWGYDDNNNANDFSFLFTVTGGTEASDFGGIGATDGVNLFADFGAYPGHDLPFNPANSIGFPYNNLNNNAQATGQGSADIFEVQPVPEPAVIAMAGLAVVMVLGGRRKAKKRLPIDN